MKVKGKEIIRISLKILVRFRDYLFYKFCFSRGETTFDKLLITHSVPSIVDVKCAHQHYTSTIQQFCEIESSIIYYSVKYYQTEI